ncbi:MAG: ATP-dependent DNA ligase, partial [Candidatus Woesearchaeota archaeon]
FINRFLYLINMLYKELAELYENLSKTNKRLEKTFLISNFIKKISNEDKTNNKISLYKTILLIQGKTYPEYVQIKKGVAEKIVIKAISKTIGKSEKDIIEKFKTLGDLGDVCYEFLKEKKQYSLFPKEFTIDEVFDIIKKLTEQEGKGSIDQKINLISNLLINSSPIEAKYLIRTLIDNLRLGFGKSTLRDSIIWAFFSEKLNINYDIEENQLESNPEYKRLTEKIQNAYDILNDYAEIAVLLAREKENALDNINIKPGKPLNLMLFYKANSIKEAFELGKPLAFEFKYDGFRLQIHKDNSEIKLFTRNLEDVSKQFPEIIKTISEIKINKIILDAEAVAFDPKTKKSIPFQLISQRIKRKYNIEELAEKFPVEIKIFDILLLEEKILLNETFENRRKILEKLVEEKKIEKKENSITLSEQIITSNEEEADSFYKKALSFGYEGIMAKNLNAVYKPGRKIGTGVKIKPIMEPLDLVITSAEYGEGKRSGFLSSFYLSCYDSEENTFKEIGKVSTGLKELEQEGFSFKELTKILEPFIFEKKGKLVKIKPEIVIEVAYEEIQLSQNYNSGYALRFPRFLRLREDKKNFEASDLKQIEFLFKTQKGKK